MGNVSQKIKMIIALGVCIALISFFGLPPQVEAWLLLILGALTAGAAWNLYAGSPNTFSHDLDTDNSGL